MSQIARRSSAAGRSKKNVPKMKRRRSSGGKLVIELQVAIQRLRPCEMASTTCRAARNRSPDPPTSEFCIAERSKATVGMPAVAPRLPDGAFRRARRTDEDDSVSATVLHPAQHRSSHLGLHARHVRAGSGKSLFDFINKDDHARSFPTL